MRTEIVYEDQDLLVIHKPAGFPTQTARIGQGDVVSELKNYLAKSGESGKEPYLGIVHRLDQPVEGLLVFAKNAKAAKLLSAGLGDGQSFHKRYYAVSFNQPLVEEGVLEDYMIKDSRGSCAKIVTKETPGAKRAVLHYHVVAANNGCVLYDIAIETGRFHQIRAQMAHAGMPLLGDRKYAEPAIQIYSEKHGIRNVALCAYELSITQPTTQKQLSFCIKPEGSAFGIFAEKGTE